MASTGAQSPVSGAPHILIVGGGCIGLGTGAALLCASGDLPSKCHITIASAEFTPNTTSDVAGGLWMPYSAKHPDLNRWTSETLEWLYALKKDGRLPLNQSIQANSSKSAVDASNPYRIGIHTVHSYEKTDELFHERQEWVEVLPEPPITKSIAEGPNTMPLGAKQHVQMRGMPVITTTKYLEKMMKDLAATKRVTFVQDKDITSLEKAGKKYAADVVINCTGLGAKDLVFDPLSRPIRGALVTVEFPDEELAKKHIGNVYLYEDNPEGLTYVICREDAIKVGGTATPGDWNTAVDEEEARFILNRAMAVVPDLKYAKVKSSRAGLRPGRDAIRVEQDHSFDHTPGYGTYTKHTLIFHNYGHGGSGWTLHWGCAKQIAALALAALDEQHRALLSTAKL